MYVFLSECLEDGLNRSEVEEALRDGDQRCSQCYTRDDYIEIIVFSVTRNRGREIYISHAPMTKMRRRTDIFIGDN